MAADTDEREVTLDIEGMTCASCVTTVERALGSVDGVTEARVNLATRTATVKGNAGEPDALFDAVRRVGYGAGPHVASRDPGEEARSFRTRLIVAVACTLPVLWLTFVVPDPSWSRNLAWALTSVVVGFSGWPFFRSAALAARHGRSTMDTLIAVGASAAYIYSVYSVLSGGDALYFDTAAVIITLILVGKVLEATARASAGDAARVLLERGAKTATVLDAGRETPTPIDQCGSGRPRAGPSGGEDPGRRGREDGCFVGGSVVVDGRIGAGRGGPRRRCRGCIDQRQRPAGGVRHHGGGQHRARRHRPIAGTGAGLEGARAATRRPHLGGLRSRRARPRGPHSPGVGRARRGRHPATRCSMPWRCC